MLKRGIILKKVASYTLGCKVNQYDTEAVLEKFIETGYEIVAFNEYADVYIVNTCTVTHLSDRKCRQMLRKTKKINKNSILIAMGCYAQIAGKKIKNQVPEIDIVVGTDKRNQIIDLVNQFEKNKHQNMILVQDIMTVNQFEEMTVSHIGERTRVYVKIQEGCDNYCSYCIIPYTRGHVRSREEHKVCEEIKNLAQLGFKEIVLTGIHILSYGKDLKTTHLIQLLQKVHEIEGIERIRLSSIEPVVVTKEFIEALAHLPKLCHHFHLSLQSGSDAILKAMNRNYTTEQYAKSVKALRALWQDVAITTDVIVGFPGETEKQFNETLEFIKDQQFAQIHIFPFSPREGTRAAKMDHQISPTIKAEREHILLVEEKKLRKDFMQQFIDQKMEVLFEKYQMNQISGYTSNYLRVQTKGNKELENTLQVVKLKNLLDENTLYGQIIKNQGNVL